MQARPPGEDEAGDGEERQHPGAVIADGRASADEAQGELFEVLLVLAVVAVEGGAALIVGRARVVETADRHGIFVYGFAPEDYPRE
jgi:hypothetical protein